MFLIYLNKFWRRFYVFNSKGEFYEKVISKFIRCYECGATPNPCIDCNRCLKFGLFLDRALELGYDGIAITDSHIMNTISGNYTSGEAAILAILAGMDMILMPADATSAFSRTRKVGKSLWDAEIITPASALYLPTR